MYERNHSEDFNKIGEFSSLERQVYVLASVKNLSHYGSCPKIIIKPQDRVVIGDEVYDACRLSLVQ